MFWRGGDTEPASTTVTAEELEIGQAIYIENCASCHGTNLEGQPDWKNYNDDGTFRAPPHDETGHTWHHGDQYLLDRIRYGTAQMDESAKALSNMPAYENLLTEAEIAAVLNYIKSSWPENIQRAQSERTKVEN